MAERLGGQENKSIWDSRLTKAGAIIAVVGVFLGSPSAAAAGVLIFGAGWAWQQKK